MAGLDGLCVTAFVAIRCRADGDEYPDLCTIELTPEEAKGKAEDACPEVNATFVFQRVARLEMRVREITGNSLRPRRA